MKLLKPILLSLILSLGMLFVISHPAFAGGCFSTTPDGSSLEQSCVKWDQNSPVVWRPENGPLKGPPSEDGNGGGDGGGCDLIPEARAIDVSNAEAVAIIERAFERWRNVPNSNLNIQKGPPLDDQGDVNFTNVENFWVGSFVTGETSTVDASGCYDNDPGTECLNPVIFDHSGLVTQAIQGACSYCFILGFAAILPETANDSPQFTITNSTLASSQAVVSGACLEPEVNDPFCSPCCPPDIDLDVVEGTMTHELGHYLGLDHTLTNKDEYLDCTDGDGCTPQDLENIPTMIGLFVPGADLRTLHQDDKSTFAKMYPANNFAANTCTIKGYATTSAGASGRCFEVVARPQGNPSGGAVAMPAGEFAPRFTQGVQDTSGSGGKNFDNCDTTPDQDPTVCGAFELKGLPPGMYDVEVQVLSEHPSNIAPIPQWAQEPCIPTRAGNILDNPFAATNVNCQAGDEENVMQIKAN